jgi:hypothetical protein
MQGLKDLVLRLQTGGVDFVLAGGFGVVAQGSSLVTRDVDVACRMEPDNLVKVFRAFETLHPAHRMTPQKLPFTLDQAEKGGLRNLYLSTDWGQLDCLGEIKGLGGYAECLAQSEEIDLDGSRIRVLTLDALITAKRAMGRPRDLHAVLELEAIREKLRGPR